jgi:hypothetical protein
MATVRICPRCNHSNLDGTLTCASCDLLLSNGMATRTMEVDASERSKTTDTIVFSGSAMLLLYVGDHNEPLRLDFRNRHVFTVGRSIPEQAADVDLNPFDAQGQGVSRQHALLSRMENALYVTDLNSANGTYLNGARLTPNKPTLVHDVDELRFGRLVTKVYWA